MRELVNRLLVEFVPSYTTETFDARIIYAQMVRMAHDLKATETLL